jgi:hypothetical protein
MGYEAIGILDSKLNTVGIWEKPEGKEVDEQNPGNLKIVGFMTFYRL